MAITRPWGWWRQGSARAHTLHSWSRAPVASCGPAQKVLQRPEGCAGLETEQKPGCKEAAPILHDCHTGAVADPLLHWVGRLPAIDCRHVLVCSLSPLVLVIQFSLHEGTGFAV